MKLIVLAFVFNFILNGLNKLDTQIVSKISDKRLNHLFCWASANNICLDTYKDHKPRHIHSNYCTVLKFTIKMD